MNLKKGTADHIRKYIGSYQTIWHQDYKFIYLKNAKTAGTTIFHNIFRNILGGYILQKKINAPEFDLWFQGDYRHQDEMVVDYNVIKKGPPRDKPGLTDQLVYDSYLFTFIRNPYERLASAYNHLGKLGPLFHDRHRDMSSFNAFLNSLNAETCFAAIDPSPGNQKKYNGYYIHWMPQWPFVYLEDGTKYVNYVGKMETLNKDFIKICQQIGIWEKISSTKDWKNHDYKLPIKNNHKYTAGIDKKGVQLKSWKSMYENTNMIDTATKYLEKDLELFGYSWED